MSPTPNAQRPTPNVHPAPCDEVAALILLRLDKMLAQAKGVRAGQESEYIHQMRVWSRRTRAALDIFHPCFEAKKFRAVEREVKAVTRALGAARDLDVMIAGLEKREAQLPPEQQAGIESFLTVLRRDRRQRQRDVEKAMEELEEFDLRDRFLLLRDNSVKGGGKKRAPKSDDAILFDPQATMWTNAARIIGVRLNALLDYAPALYDPKQVYELHQMRIAAKRLRYTLEIFEESVARDSRYEEQYAAAIETIRTLQEHLGEIHDADVLVPRLLEHLSHLLADGYGVQENGDPIAGVRRVDLDACEGILALCREARDSRERRYARLLRDWERILEAGGFDRLRALLHEIALAAPQPDTRSELVAASPSTTEAHHGEEDNPTAESLPPTPGAAKRAAAARRRAAPPAGNSRSGTDSSSGAS